MNPTPSQSKQPPAKIVLFGSFVPQSQPGGITTHCTRLAERLENEPTCAVRRVNLKLRGSLLHSLLRSNPATWLYAALNAHFAGFRIFHFNSSARNIPFPILAPALRLLGSRLILSFHSGALSTNLNKNGILANALFRISLALAHRVIFMNEREKNAIATHFPQYASKFSAIHSFIIPSTQTRENALANAKTLLSNDTPPENRQYTIACMGAWLHYYLFEDVLTALQRTAQTFQKQKFKLKIAAALFNFDLAYKQKIETAIATLLTDEKNKNITITTEENVADPLTFLANSDLLVRSSSVDSFGLCVAEALFLGKPAIATNVCRRVEGTLLYTPHDIDTLEKLIRTAYERYRDGTQTPLSLSAAEDAFPKLLQLYKEEAAA